MQRINAYYYPNRVEVLADVDPTITTRNKIVYARTLKIHRGIDNNVVFTVKNSDQKPVNLTNHRLFLSVINDNDNSKYIEIEGSAVDATKGTFNFVLVKDEVNNLDQEWYNYALRAVATATNQEFLLFADDYFTARGQLQVHDGHAPAFNVSDTLVLADAGVNERLSSAVPLGLSNVFSFQIYFSNFTGTITPQATLDPLANINSGSWFDLTPVNYTTQAQTVFQSFDDGYTAMRYKITTTSGSVVKILSRT